MVHYSGHALVGSWARLEGAIFLCFRSTFLRPPRALRGVFVGYFCAPGQAKKSYNSPMKRFLLAMCTALLTACSAFAPYKNQSTDYLKNMEENPAKYRGKVVSFGGEIKGVAEDTQRIRLVLKTDIPFYYAAVGKSNEYELLLVEYPKPTPQMSGITQGNTVKVLARVGTYEKRQNAIGMPIGVLHLRAFALTNRTQKKDFFHTTSPEKQLYESWKKGRLFYQESAEKISAQYPPEPTDPATSKPTKKSTSKPAPTIIYDEVEDFVIN